VIDSAEALAKQIRSAKWMDEPVRVKVDKREKLSPGFKFNDWEMKGACLRIELGPRDLEAGTCVLASRLGGDKETLSLEDVSGAICIKLDSFGETLFQRALEFRNTSTRRVDTWEEFKAAFEGDGGGGFVLAHWDGTEETEEAISEATKATIRCIPLSPLAPDDDQPGICVFSGKPSVRRVVFAKAY